MEEMYKMRKEPNKHLTYEEREFVEIGLNNRRNFTDIAKDLKKHRTTIMREVQGHKFRKTPSKFNNAVNLCRNRRECQSYVNVFDELTQEKTNLIMSHIKSTSRDKLNGKTPYEAELLILDEDEINKKKKKKIKADEVNLSPKLLKEAEQSQKIIHLVS